MDTLFIGIVVGLSILVCLFCVCTLFCAWKNNKLKSELQSKSEENAKPPPFSQVNYEIVKSITNGYVENEQQLNPVQDANNGLLANHLGENGQDEEDSDGMYDQSIHEQTIGNIPQDIGNDGKNNEFDEGERNIVGLNVRDQEEGDDIHRNQKVVKDIIIQQQVVVTHNGQIDVHNADEELETAFV